MDFVLGGDASSGCLTTSINSTVTLQGKPGAKFRCRVLSYVPCREPAHEIPPMTRSGGENLTGKVNQVFRDSEELPLVLALKMVSVFLMPASIDYSLISVTHAEGLPQSLSK